MCFARLRQDNNRACKLLSKKIPNKVVGSGLPVVRLSVLGTLELSEAYGIYVAHVL